MLRILVAYLISVDSEKLHFSIFLSILPWKKWYLMVSKTDLPFTKRLISKVYTNTHTYIHIYTLWNKCVSTTILWEHSTSSSVLFQHGFSICLWLFFPSHWILVVKWYVFFSFSHASCYSFRSSECMVWFSIFKILSSLTTSWDILRRQRKATFLVSIYRSQNKHSVGIPAIKQLYIHWKSCIFGICRLERKFLFRRDAITNQHQSQLACWSVFITGLLYITL